MKRIGLGLIVIAVLLLGAAPLVGASEVCKELDSGKIDVVGNFKSITITADEGYLITGYCVKAGSSNQDLGPVYVEVAPPVASVTFSYPLADKDISHYSYSYKGDVPSTTTTTAPPTTTSTTQSTTTTVERTTTTVTVPVTTTIPYDVVPPTVPTPTTTTSAAPPSELPFTGIDTGLLWLGLAVFGAGLGTLGFLRWFERNG